MKGFFLIEGLFDFKERERREKGNSAKERSREELEPCEICGLHKECHSPKMSWTGEGKKRCLVIAEAPGAEEDRRGKQLVGDAGQLLREKLDLYGLDLDRDFWKINAVNCRPPKNRKPTKKEIKLCRPRVQQAIKELNPQFIWLLGGTAVESFYMGRFRRLGITRWRRWCIPDYDSGAWVVPLYHPSYILRNQHDKNLVSVYDRDLKWAVSCFRRGNLGARPDFESCVTTLTVCKEAVRLLKEILWQKPKEIAFDYETSGLKPYNSCHRVWSVAVAFRQEGELRSYSFPLDYPVEGWGEKERKTIKRLWNKILGRLEIKKVAHNLKFENLWSSVCLGHRVENWHWCTMVTSHLLDNRKDITGLKFQSYVRYGVKGYEDEVRPYISSRPGRETNRLDQFPLEKLLFYNGMDALLTFHLYEDQRRELSRRKELERARKFFLKGLLALSDAEQAGIRTDVEHFTAEFSSLEEEEENILQDIMNSSEVKEFEKVQGRPFKPTSSKDLQVLLFDIMKLKPLKVTPSGQASVDKESMSSLGVAFADKIVRLRKMEKIKGTYISQFLREVGEDGRLHPFFDLHTSRTYRSSSSMPNFQNIPVRDEEAKRITRKGLLPSPGYRICEVDYGSLEVRIAACYTKDQSLVNYIHDKSTDMHRDMAAVIWNIPVEEVTKELRFYAKNGWVFPQFYGDWYKSCARVLWDACSEMETVSGVGVRSYLRKKGIRDYAEFEDHCRDVERHFWKERFSDYYQWKQDINDFYRRRGYVETYLGFRYQGYMSAKEVTNYPIQGTAFHCLLWSLIRINDLIKDRGLRSRIIGQIHDSIVFDLYPEEEDFLLPTVKRIMTQDLREEFDWIIVPMEVEFELTEVNEPWYYKKEVAL